MVYISNKAFVFLVCIGLLVVLPKNVSSLTSLHSQQQNELMMSKSRRMLNGLVREELNTGIKSAPAPASKTFDLNDSNSELISKSQHMLK
ncbi:hypothetical protein FXO38_30136 [Capsicum annuum]|nr:hypothetical protein FXO38_30136 [Capsicum annuum]KAF3632136.1 hypothetical protein FXO37_27655 [Capsicum annuum]